MNTTTQVSRIASSYTVSDAEWRSGRVTITRPDGTSVRITAGELAAASRQEDADLRAVYDTLYRRALAKIAAARSESVHRCTGHRAESTRVSGFTGPVSRDENRAAHGNICETETCRCGAERSTNINQHHVERGIWS